ncbi:hypothetical protein, partial [Escherichia coli]|uniref:hypothetical protein n=1 Tax=Escherichia coli TaxID=562 RepID=UPI001BDB8442
MPISFRGDVPRQAGTYAEQSTVLARLGVLRVVPLGLVVSALRTAAVDLHEVQVNDHVGHRRKFGSLSDE